MLPFPEAISQDMSRRTKIYERAINSHSKQRAAAMLALRFLRAPFSSILIASVGAFHLTAVSLPRRSSPLNRVFLVLEIASIAAQLCRVRLLNGTRLIRHREMHLQSVFSEASNNPAICGSSACRCLRRNFMFAMARHKEAVSLI